VIQCPKRLRLHPAGQRWQGRLRPHQRRRARRSSRPAGRPEGHLRRPDGAWQGSGRKPQGLTISDDLCSVRGHAGANSSPLSEPALHVGLGVNEGKRHVASSRGEDAQGLAQCPQGGLAAHLEVDRACMMEIAEGGRSLETPGMPPAANGQSTVAPIGVRAADRSGCRVCTPRPLAGGAGRWMTDEGMVALEID
jgi:hypothetical protein